MEGARLKIAEMQKAGDVYFNGRGETIKNITDPELQDRAEARLDDSQKQFAGVLQSLSEAGDSLQPFRKSLADHTTFLGSDLTPSAMTALKPNADKPNAQGADLVTRTDKAIAGATGYFQSLKSCSSVIGAAARRGYRWAQEALNPGRQADQHRCDRQMGILRGADAGAHLLERGGIAGVRIAHLAPECAAPSATRRRSPPPARPPARPARTRTEDRSPPPPVPRETPGCKSRRAAGPGSRATAQYAGHGNSFWPRRYHAAQARAGSRTPDRR